MRFAGRTAFVSGAGSGIGRATAELLAEEGATVVVADVDPSGGEETVDRIADAGGEAVFRELDVRDGEAFREVVDETAERHGLDVVVNNAGVGHHATDMEEVPDEMRDFVVETNAEGVWNGCRAAIPHLKDQGSGAIVNTASVAAMVGLPGQAAYSLSKAAVLNLTRAVAGELGPHGVRANAVCPGLIETPLTAGASEEDHGIRLEDIPVGRVGRPEDVADCVAFLASDDAAYVTGHGLVVDGGFTA